ncbi:MAG: DMT family transporter [Alphaproteobacteria bacterium]|nr:DMT family transporter [Alphaproteobacteria bacterium]
MTVASAAFAVLIGLIRYLAEQYDQHPFEIAFFRNFFGLVFMLPWLLRAGFSALKTERLGLYTIRSGLGLIAMLAWFTAVTMMPLAEAVALSFTVPLFATATAPFFLNERVGWRRWSATVAGFAGAMILLRPGIGIIDPAALLVLTAALAWAATVILIKLLSQTESANAMVTYMVLFLTPASLIPALFVWKTPVLEEWPVLIALGATATIGHLTMTRAFAVTDVTAVLPFDYLRLPFVAVIGFLVFAQVPDLMTWVGGVVIALSAIYIAEREARLKRTAITPASAAAIEGTGPTVIQNAPEAGASDSQKPKDET